MEPSNYPIAKAREEMEREQRALYGLPPLNGPSEADKLLKRVEAEQRATAELYKSNRLDLLSADRYRPRHMLTNVPTDPNGKAFKSVHRDDFTAEDAQAIIDLARNISRNRTEPGFDFLFIVNERLIAK